MNYSQITLFDEPSDQKPKKKKNIYIAAELLAFDQYNTCIVSYSDGIDSTGALYRMLKIFPKEKIILLNLDTGLEHPINKEYLKYVAKTLGLKYVYLEHPKGFKYMLANERKKWPDMQNRWCTAYLKTDLCNRWIRNNRELLGEKVLFVSGERRDESPGRAKLLDAVYHHTHLWTTRKANFTCHWYRPVLDEEKGLMFEYGKRLGLEPHPCYKDLPRCSCIACPLMSQANIQAGMKLYPEEFKELIEIEKKIGHTWQKGKSLEIIWNSVCDLVATPAEGLIA